jgi:antitoxin HigA-1
MRSMSTLKTITKWEDTQMTTVKRRPTHPGAILREDILPEANINQTELADLLKTSRRTVNEIINERRPVTPDMAHRLARVFANSPEFWLNLQQSVDIWEAKKQNKDVYAHLKPLAAAAR